MSHELDRVPALNGSRAGTRALALAGDVEPNPVRALWSLMDALRDRLSHGRAVAWVTIAPLEWLVSLVAVAAVLDLTGLVPAFEGAPRWLVVGAAVLAPYAVFQIVRLAWQPVPFFMADEVPRVALPSGAYAAACFGHFTERYESRDFWRLGRPRATRIRFGWSPGEVRLGRRHVEVRAVARTVVYRAAFEGRIERVLEARVPGDAVVRRGTATRFFRRLPAVEVVGPDYRIVAILLA